MSDPVRLASAATSKAARELLRGARVGPPPGLKERAMSAALEAFAAPGASAGAGGAGAAKASSLVNVHWVGVACLAGALAAGGLLASRVQHDVVGASPPAAEPATAGRLNTSAPAPTAAVTVADDWSPVAVEVTSLPAVAVQTPASAPARRIEPPTAQAPSPAPGPDDAPPHDTVTPGPSLSSEILSLDLTRKALAAHDGHRALSLLRDYDARFPDGALRSEAVMLRIETLVSVDRKADAARLGREVIAGDPDGPYVARIQSLLGDAKP
jgi:hypothetical protein